MALTGFINIALVSDLNVDVLLAILITFVNFEICF